MHQSRGVTRSPNQPIPTRGRKQCQLHTIVKADLGTNPSPSGDENIIISVLSSNSSRTNPSPDGDELKSTLNRISFCQEPTHPHSGTNFLKIPLYILFRGTNQPTPTRGRKLHNLYVRCESTLNQPIPTRGRKQLAEIREINYLGTIPSPDGDENALRIFVNFSVVIRNQPNPKRGRKSYISKSILSEFANQPIPKRGRKFTYKLIPVVPFKNQPIPTRGRKFCHQLPQFLKQ